jgi:glucose-1-phosphate thymidylyltransferase
MKGIILAGGLATRLRPLTLATNKHLLPIYNKPMIFYPIKTLVDAGITEILVVTGGPHAGHFIRVLQNGKHLGISHLEYAYQEKEGGIAEALSLAEDFSDNESVCVILGDNCTDTDISGEVKTFKKGARVFLKKVPDPERFGVPTFNKTGGITKITEKPKNPASSYAVTGLYFYDKTVFQKIKKLKPSQRGELEVTDINNMYLAEKALSWFELQGFWRDAGTFKTLFDVGEYWRLKEES